MTPPEPPIPMSEPETAARHAVAAEPESALAWHGLAFALIDAGKLEEACDSLARAVALDPASPMAHNNHGIVLHRLGRAEAACAAYRAALALDPENPAAHNNIACVLGELGQFQACLDHARRAVAADPGQLGAYVHAAIAEAHLDHRDAGLAWLDRALAVAPRSARILVERADLLRELGRAEEGLEACLAALALEPDNVKARNGLGLLFQALGRDEEALAAFDHALTLTSEPAKIHANKAVVLMELGRTDAARESLDHALTHDPGLAAAWFIRADLKRFSAGDREIGVMEALLADGPRTEHETILLHYALAKAYQDLEDGDRLFDHLGRGGQLKRASIVYDPDAAQREMTALARAFPASLFQARGEVGDPSPAPIFIIGMPRSGGTLIEQILASHPKVRAGGEARHIEAIRQSLGGAYPSGLGDLPDDAIAALGARYLAMAPPADGAERITDKAANHFLHVGLIHLILPQARLIHCRRDPVDTCLSCYSKLFASGQEFTYDLTELGGYYRLYSRLMDHWRGVINPDRFLEVDYERVVEDLEGQTRRLLAFCGLEWNDACLRFHETDRPVRTASLHQVRRPIYRTSLGRWTRYREHLAPLITALGDVIR